MFSICHHHFYRFLNIWNNIKDKRAICERLNNFYCICQNWINKTFILASKMNYCLWYSDQDLQLDLPTSVRRSWSHMPLAVAFLSLFTLLAFWDSLRGREGAANSWSPDSTHYQHPPLHQPPCNFKLSLEIWDSLLPMS